MFEFRRLKHFVAVAEELHVGRAAVRLHMSQPPLSRSIHQLEESLGVELFIRTSQGVELTNEGEVFLKEAGKILQMVERACEFTTQAKRGEIGRLVIAYYGSAILNILPRLIAEFKSHYPLAEVSLHHMSKQAQIQALRDHSIHIGLIRYVNDEPDIVQQEIVQEPILLALPDNHRLVAMAEIEIEELKQEPRLMFPRASGPSFSDLIIGFCRKAGFVPNISQEADDMQSCIALVSAGLGVSLVPQSSSALKLPGVVYRPLADKSLKSELSCIYLADRRAPVLDAFLSCVENIKADLCDSF